LLTSHHSRGGGAWLLLLGEQCPGRSGSSAFANKNPAFLGEQLGVSSRDDRGSGSEELAALQRNRFVVMMMTPLAPREP